MFLKAYAGICKFGKVRKTEKTLADFSEKSKCLKKKKNYYHFVSALFSKDMLRIVKGFAPWILFDGLRKSFYIHWSAERSPRVHEVNPGQDPSTWYQSKISELHECPSRFYGSHEQDFPALLRSVCDRVY